MLNHAKTAPREAEAPLEARAALTNPVGHILGRHDGLPAASTSPASKTTMYVAIGASVGCVLLIAIVAVTVWILRARRHHRKAVVDMEHATTVPMCQMEEAPRPAAGVSCSSLMPLNTQAGWDALSSKDSVHQQAQAASNGKRKRSTARMPKKARRPKSAAVRSSKHLSAIVESPRISSQEPIQEKADKPEASPQPEAGGKAATAYDWSIDIADYGLGRTESPLPDVSPSFAVQSPARHGAAMANEKEHPKAVRAISTGALGADCTVFGHIGHIGHIIRSNSRPRPPMHQRSVSLGAPPSAPPSGPVPPLPVIPPLKVGNRDSFRNGVVVALSNSSSMNSFDSAGSSVFVTSPILKVHDDNQDLLSPTVEEVIAEDDHAELKSVPNGQWQNPHVSMPGTHTNDNSSRTEKPRASVRGSMMRNSSDSFWSRLPSTASSRSGDSRDDRLSIPQIATADRVSMSRVSSTNSLYGIGGVQKIETSTRRKSLRHSRVSASGSPVGRASKSTAVRGMSGHTPPKANILWRVSGSTQGSSRSSNGNPFHWDHSPSSTLPKHSALKGSPNARKGHRRQNFVRISTLTPQVFGPASTQRSSSLARLSLGEIREEREGDEVRREKDQRNTSSESCPRIQTLRASLTPSSPTLSAWNQYPEQQTGCAPQLSIPNLSLSPVRHADSRQSDRSLFTISNFPSPSKARASVAVTKLDIAPMLEFSLSPESLILGFEDKDSVFSPLAARSVSNEEGPSPVSAEASSPVEYSPVSPVDMPSPPSLPVSKTKEYDPAWPMVTLPAPSAEYDPASPPVVWDENGPERSNWLLPFAMNPNDSQDPSWRGRPSSRVAKDEEPPGVTHTLDPFSQSTEKLTSESASSIMARMPEKTSSFLGTSLPVLLPPPTDEENLNRLPYRPRIQSHHTPTLPRHCRTPSPTHPGAPTLPTIPASDSPPQMPRPLNICARGKSSPTSPRGPRSAPARSVIHSVSSLRRMNSEAQSHRTRESRNYVRIGREASLLLPWIGDSDSEREGSALNLFALDFHARPGPGEGEGKGGCRWPYLPSGGGGAMDEIDFAAIAKDMDGAIAEFQESLSGAVAGEKEEERTRSPAKTRSVVWDDGGEYWEAERPQKRRTADPRRPLTPMEKSKCDPRVSVGGTPKSLYDADGFLKT